MLESLDNFRSDEIFRSYSMSLTTLCVRQGSHPGSNSTINTWSGYTSSDFYHLFFSQIKKDNIDSTLLQ